MNIAVVDAGGCLLAFALMDDAWRGSVDIAIGKACKNARQEQQLHHDVSLALAHRAAALRDVEREPSRAVVPPAGERRISEDPSHMVEHAAVGG